MTRASRNCARRWFVAAANNQLAEPRHGRALHARGILYAPDYLVNAGGVINVSAEVGGEYDAERVRQRR